ncbi:transmembrane channel-like protein 5 isoform X2 [Biomphalaria pfeifferi]|uniref:Transmembrane channel-like protein 5 isoform X2 n=1 Tax=Biomphalaria pfeifferi TaxID=112525 RepID=A0AAD8FD82_BIOPF|nr:transmembrane channel-like protein 5 isoform X2 [Biomphalaria pfeifferi]
MSNLDVSDVSGIKSETAFHKSGSSTDLNPMSNEIFPSMSQFSAASDEFKTIRATNYFRGYDWSMAELLQKLPSRQLENVADLAARTLLRKKSLKPHRMTLRLSREDSLEDDIMGSLDQDLQSATDLSGYLDSAVRTFPTTLSKKRNIKHSILVKVKKPERGLPLLKYRLNKVSKYFMLKWRQFNRLLDLWRSHLLIIEGSFGTSVVSYFIFLKWVLLINVPVFLFTFTLLVIPALLYSWYGSQKLEDDVSFSFLDLFTGCGYLENSIMYYGFYTNQTMELVPGHSYEMKYVYLFTCAGYYILCLIILGYSYLRSYRIYYIEAGGPTINCYFNIFVSGWDYGITSNEASQLKHKSLYNEFKENLYSHHKKKSFRDKDELTKLWLIRTLTWLLVIVMLTLSGYITYFVSTELSITNKLAEESKSYSTLKTLAMPIVLSSIQQLFPLVFSFLELYEEYSSPKKQLYVHMFRAMAFKGTMLAVLVYFWFAVASSNIECWETFVGEEIYRLVIVDLIFVLGYSFFMEFMRKICSQRWEWIKKAEFAIAQHTLELIYSQSLCWLGFFFAPLLPLVVIMKLVLIFYVKRFSLMNNCTPSVKSCRDSRTHTIFVGYLFIFFLLCCIAVGYSIVLIKPSNVCGPYQNYSTIYEAINTDMISRWRNDSPAFNEISQVVNSPGFVAGVLIFMFMVLYYTRTISISHRAMVEQLQLQLISEGKDKKFLMNLLNQVKIRGHKQGILHPGPVLQKALADYSGPATASDAHGGKVFIRMVADSILGSPLPTGRSSPSQQY